MKRGVESLSEGARLLAPVKLQLYILRQLGTSFLFAVGGVLFIALPGIAVTTVQKMPLADASVLMRYVPLVLENLAPYVLPICFLLSVVATYGRLASDREWTAIQMAGVQPLKMLLPGLWIALALGAGNYWMVTEELPRAKVRQRAALIGAAASSLQNLQPGRTTINFPGFVLKAEWRDPDDQHLFYGVVIRRPGEDGTSRIDMFAEQAHIRAEGNYLRADLYNAEMLVGSEIAPTEGEESNEGVLTREESGRLWADRAYAKYALDKLVAREDRRDSRPKYMTNAQIWRELDGNGAEEPRTTDGDAGAASMPAEGETLDAEQEALDRALAESEFNKRNRRLRFQLHNRVAISTAFLLFLGLGAPTGLLLRRGTQLGALSVAVGFGLVYYILSMRVGKELGNSGTYPPWLGAWITPILFSSASIVLLHKAMRR